MKKFKAVDSYGRKFKVGKVAGNDSCGVSVKFAGRVTKQSFIFYRTTVNAIKVYII